MDNIMTIVPNDIDQQLYFIQLLINLPSLPIRQLPKWLPDNWKIHHKQSMENQQNPTLRPV